MKDLENFYLEVDRIKQLLSKINFHEQGETININAYSTDFQNEVKTATNRIKIHGYKCLNTINNLLNKC
jgi:hypothetical protein